MVDYHQNEFKAFLVLEHAGDMTLEKFFTNHKASITLDRIKLLTKDLLNAVTFLHLHKVVHRDIKPDNIMITLEPELRLKLIDFNIAHDLDEEPEIKGANGVRAWSAPETRKFINYDKSCDIWSVGCILHYLCSGKPPSDPLKLENAAERFSESHQRDLFIDLM